MGNDFLKIFDKNGHQKVPERESECLLLQIDTNRL